MALLDLIGDVCDQVGLLRPASVITSLDKGVKQLLALANREGQELATGDSVSRAFFWTALNTEATFVTLAAEVQGNITTLLPGFRRLIGETLWNRSLNQRIPPISVQDWQAMKSAATVGTSPYFRFRGSQLLFTPTPTAGQTVAVEYSSGNWCTNAAGTLSYNAWTADTDIPRLPADILRQGIVWRWKAAKNFDYAEDFRSYQTIVLNAMANDGENPILSAAGYLDWRPSIMVPSGSWTP